MAEVGHQREVEEVGEQAGEFGGVALEHAPMHDRGDAADDGCGGLRGQMAAPAASAPLLG